MRHQIVLINQACVALRVLRTVPQPSCEQHAMCMCVCACRSGLFNVFIMIDGDCCSVVSSFLRVHAPYCTRKRSPALGVLSYYTVVVQL